MLKSTIFRHFLLCFGLFFRCPSPLEKFSADALDWDVIFAKKVKLFNIIYSHFKVLPH